jgi:hypothetical protein
MEKKREYGTERRSRKESSRILRDSVQEMRRLSKGRKDAASWMGRRRGDNRNGRS